MIKVSLFLIVAALPLSTEAVTTSLHEAKASLQYKLDRREAQLKANEEKIENLRVPHLKRQIIKPTTKMDFGNNFLKCHTSRFPWPMKGERADNKDCLFKLNIGKPDDVKKLYATLQAMKAEGWEVERSEVFKQQIINESKIFNEERYRFVKLN